MNNIKLLNKIIQININETIEILHIIIKNISNNNEILNIIIK